MNSWEQSAILIRRFDFSEKRACGGIECAAGSENCSGKNAIRILGDTDLNRSAGGYVAKIRLRHVDVNSQRVHLGKLKESAGASRGVNERAGIHETLGDRACEWRAHFLEVREFFEAKDGGFR